MTVQLIQLTESLRWALEMIRRQRMGESLPPGTIEELAAWGHLAQAECDLRQFDQDMTADSAASEAQRIFKPIKD